MTGYVGILATCIPKLTQTAVSCDPEFYLGRQTGYGKMWSFALWQQYIIL